MNIKPIINALFLWVSIVTFAQDNTDVLFTVDEEPVMASEFIRVYNKNLDLVKDESQKDIDAYLKLFVNYQLKVKEAKRLDFDKNPQYIREFSNYKKQLTKSYLSDNKVTDALVKEAYERTSQDVKAVHILVRIDESEKDTVAVYNRLLKLRERVIAEGFEKVQKEVHNGKSVFAEDLGYFTGFKMVYSFENAAYNTKVGEISMPFRTRFGYHIVKVLDKRPSLGKVTVAHIMVSNRQKDSLLDPEVRINEIYRKIEQGEKFESLAKQFSDDKSSASKGGILAPFTGGQLSSQEFEKVAFDLNKRGEVSQSFKTDYGWHIVKLINKSGVPPFEEIKAELENKVKRDSRSKLINTALAKKLKDTYKVVDNQEALTYFENQITKDFFKRAWKKSDISSDDKVMFSIGDTEFLYESFSQHLMAVQRNYMNRKVASAVVIEKEYEAYLEAKLLNYHEGNLEFENQEFAYVLKEYRDGLLLFDLMEKEVWSAATKDSIGLQSFYDNHKNNYVWEDRVDAVVVSAAKKKDISEVLRQLKKGVVIDDITAVMNSEGEQKIITTKGMMEINHQALPKNLELKKGISKRYQYNDAYHVIDVKEVKPKSIKTFDEARGKVINDYQNYIEENWLNSLNERYEVKINQSVLEKVKLKITN